MTVRRSAIAVACLSAAIAATSSSCVSNTHCWAPVVLAGSQTGTDVDVNARRENYAGEWSKRCALRHWGQATGGDIEVASLPIGTIAAAFCDEDGEPLEGVTVIVPLYDGARSQFSDENGEVRFADLPAGTYKVLADYAFTRIERTITLPATTGVAFAWTPKVDVNGGPEDGPSHACCQSQPVLSGRVADANFSFLVRSSTDPGTVANENPVVTPRPLTQVSQPIQFDIIDEPMVWAERFAGFKVRMTNISDADINLTAHDGSIDVVQQARDRDGNWRDLEYKPNYFCGNSYARWVFRAGTAWEFIAPRFTGRFTTELRFAFVDASARYADPAVAAKHPLGVMYSQTFIGSINDSQFTRRRHRRWHRGEVDPYGEIQ